jgi:GAF domain
MTFCNVTSHKSMGSAKQTQTSNFHTTQHNNNNTKKMKAYSVRIPSLQLFVPSGKFESEYELKEYALRHCRSKLLEQLIVEPMEEDDHFVAESTDAEVVVQELCRHHVPLCSSAHFSKKLQLLNTMAHVQRQFFHSESPKIIFGAMLDALLDLMDSEYGFIGETKFEEDGTIYLQTHAITNVAWDQATRQFYDDNVDQGLKFFNMETLFGAVIKTKQGVIANNPKIDARAGGVPNGHPPLRHFLGIPFFKPGGELNGMVGIANKPDGYCEEDIDFLEVSGTLITAHCLYV